MLRVLVGIWFLAAEVVPASAEIFAFRCNSAGAPRAETDPRLVFDTETQTVQFFNWQDVSVLFWEERFIGWTGYNIGPDDDYRAVGAALFDRQTNRLAISFVFSHQFDPDPVYLPNMPLRECYRPGF